MTENRADMIKFRPRRTFRPTLIFFAGFGIFAVIGAVMIFQGIRGGIVMIVFSAAFMLILGIQVRSPGSYYAISKKGIHVRIMFRRRIFPFSEITGLRIINDYDARSEMKKLEYEKNKGMNNVSIRQAFEAQMKIGRFIQYSTATIVFSETSSCTESEKNGFSINAKGMFIEVETFKGERFLISPCDVNRFESTYRDFSG